MPLPVALEPTNDMGTHTSLTQLFFPSSYLHTHRVGDEESGQRRPWPLLRQRAGRPRSSQQLEQAGEAPPMASWSRPLLPAARARWGCSSRWRQWAARDCSSRHDGEQVRVALARAAWRECAMAASRCVASKCAMAVRPFGEQIERTRRRSSREGPQIPYARTG